MTSTVSVVIPAYNRADLIEETLQSIFDQTVEPYEVIVVDDGSSDGTAEVARNFDTRVRVYQQENKGAGAARNFGFSKSTGEFIHFMDSDDLSSPNTYDVQLKALIEKSADFAYGPWVKTWFLDSGLKFHSAAIQQHPFPNSIPAFHWMLRGWLTVFQPCLLRRTLIEKIGPYRTDLKPSEDCELLFRISKSGAKFVHTPETILLYRVHTEAQVSTANNREQRLDWLRYLNAIEDHLNDNVAMNQATSLSHAFIKLNAIRHADVSQTPEAKKLSRKISMPQRNLELVSRPFRRIQAKLRRMKYGGNYGAAFGADKLRTDQLKLIEKMGQKFDAHSI